MQQSEAARRRRANRKRLRLLLLLAFLAGTLGAGMYTPGPQATLVSRLILVVFSFSLLMSLSMAVVLIPSPPDPRERMRSIFGWQRRDPTEDQSDADESHLTGIPSPADLQRAALRQRRGR